MDYPTFIINGFLDAGKSTFITDTLKNDGFSKQGNTLLLVCEQGEVEYDEKELSKYRVKVAYFEEEKDFTIDAMFNLTEEFHPDRIVIETNTMWNMNEIHFPATFKIGQIVSFIDFTTFEVYYNNMRQKFVDNLRFSDLIVINRCDDVSKLAKYQTSLKIINNNAQWLAMNSAQEVQEAFEAPLPYDINQPIIKIEDQDYARWYIDTFDHKDRYEGKTVEFNGICLRSPKLPKGSVLIGRYAMTCCAKDMQLYAHLCNSMMGLKLKSKTWVHIVAKVTYEYSKEYEEEEVILNPIKLEVIPALAEPVLNLT